MLLAHKYFNETSMFCSQNLIIFHILHCRSLWSCVQLNLQHTWRNVSVCTMFEIYLYLMLVSDFLGLVSIMDPWSLFLTFKTVVGPMCRLHHFYQGTMQDLGFACNPRIHILLSNSTECHLQTEIVPPPKNCRKSPVCNQEVGEK